MAIGSMKAVRTMGKRNMPSPTPSVASHPVKECPHKVESRFHGFRHCRRNLCFVVTRRVSTGQHSRFGVYHGARRHSYGKVAQT